MFNNCKSNLCLLCCGVERLLWFGLSKKVSLFLCRSSEKVCALLDYSSEKVCTLLDYSSEKV